MDIYKIIEDNVVSQMTPVIELTLIETVSTGRYKLYSCNTEWATIGDTITIDSVDYLVVDFEINDFLIVTGPSLPVQLYFQLSAPTFEYGNHRKVSIERDKQKDKKPIQPMVYMMLVRNTRVKDYDSAYSFDGEARFFFLGAYNEKKDDIDTHQHEVIEPMRAMAKYFREKWNDREDLFEQITECAEQDWMNFGSPQIWGNNPRIFDENLSGVENAFRILSTAEEDCCENIPAPSCLPIELQFNSVLAETIPSGSVLDITLEDQDGNTPNYSYDAPTDTLTVQTDGGGSSTAEVVNSDASFSASFDTADNPYEIPDSPVNFNSNPVESIPATSTKEVQLFNNVSAQVGIVAVDTPGSLILVAPDGLVNVRDSANNLLFASPVVSGGTDNPQVDDSVVSNSDDSYVVNVLATQPLELPDTTYNFYVGSNPVVTETIPSLKNETFTIVWQ